jgi:RNA polymerase sigma-70 factor (ECF subfamily)
MSEATVFADLVRRVRAGDPDAAAELVRRYEPTIRRIARLRLDPQLRRFVESLDICQEVLHSFFVRAALGQYELDTEEQLLHLLGDMARNKAANLARRQRAEQRDVRRLEPESGAVETALASGPSPSQVVAGRELLQKFRERLSEQERQLADWRAQGREWADIAAELGESAEALRKRLERGIKRVARVLGLEEVFHV